MHSLQKTPAYLTLPVSCLCSTPPVLAGFCGHLEGDLIIILTRCEFLARTMLTLIWQGCDAAG